jgi:hypothetical protein
MMRMMMMRSLATICTKIENLILTIAIKRNDAIAITITFTLTYTLILTVTVTPIFTLTFTLTFTLILIVMLILILILILILTVNSFVKSSMSKILKTSQIIAMICFIHFKGFILFVD